MITVQDLGMHFGGRILFEDVSFQVSVQDKIGLTGRNGSGKSTLLKLLSGNQSPSDGTISYAGDIEIGYLQQDLKTHGDRSVYDEARSAFTQVLEIEKILEDVEYQVVTRTDYESDSYMDLLTRQHELQDRLNLLEAHRLEERIGHVLRGLGFETDDLSRPVSELSGGWQMRVELAKILLRKPHVLLLDEPTNHLDIHSITWLEQWLKNYNGAIILVSHDKTFLDVVTNRTIEVTLSRIEDYPVPYTKYLTLRQERKEQQLAAAKGQERKVKQLERNIERFRAKASKATFAQSLIKKLDKMERVEVENESLASMNIKFPKAKHSGRIVAEGKKVHKSFGDNVVLHGLDFEVERNERLAFVGKNGMGKTTLMRIIAGELDHKGEVNLGHNVLAGYYAQQHTKGIEDKHTVLEEMEAAATAETSAQVRSLLGAFLFSGDDVHKKVRVLSGGERARLALAKLLLRPVNFLLLDEPTNHLDMLAKDVLKAALKSFDGTLIVVSHDRDFLDGLTDKVFEFTKDGVKQHLGGIYEFLQKKQAENFRELEAEYEKKSARKSGLEEGNKEDFKQRKERDRELRKYRTKVEASEQKIAQLEKEIAQLDKKFSDPDFQHEAVVNTELFARYEDLKKKLADEMKQWEKAVVEMEGAERN